MAAVPPLSNFATSPAPAVKVADARAAFFRQALAATQSPQAAPLAAPQAARTVAPAPMKLATIPDVEPDRPMRPGSFVNIRV